MPRIGRGHRAPARAAIAAAIAGILLPCLSALAQQGPPADGPTRPDAARRVVRVFDFEERSFNPFPWPRHWLRAQDGLRARAENGGEVAFKRPGFPRWNLAELDYSSPAFAGSGSLKLPTQGGSTALRLEPGVIPVFPDADYVISARVRTQGLAVARARMSAAFLDAQGRPIETSRVTSELLVSEGVWSSIEIELRGRNDDASFMEIELALVQPQEQAAPNASLRPAAQDYSGAAWFDDVSIAQLPRIELTSAAPGGVFLAPEAPSLRFNIRDLTGEDLTAQISVIDSRGTVVDRVTQDVGAGRASGPLTPSVPRFGWYRAALGVFSRDALVGRTHADFLWLDADPLGTSDTRRLSDDRRRFGVCIEPAPTSGREELVTRRLGTGSVIIPAWSAAVTPGGARDFARELSAGVEPFLEHGQLVTLVLPRMPDDLAAVSRMDPDDVWRVLAGDPAVRAPFLDPVLERLGQRVHRWQVGAVGDRRAVSSRTLASDIEAASRALSGLVPTPVLCVPWRAGQALPASTPPARFSLLVERGTPLEATVAAAESGSPGSGRELEFVFECGPDDLYGFGPGLAELARGAITLWAADRSRPGGPETPGIGLALLTPWTMGGKDRTDIEPRPELGVWSTLARRLSQRRCVGEYPAGAGVKCFILAPAPGSPDDAPGALAAWSDGTTEDACLRGYLGQGQITFVDLFGNSAPAPADEAPARSGRAASADQEGNAEPARARWPAVRIPLTGEPLFVEGVDARLVKFLSSVRIDPPLLKPTNETHEHAIVFDNPWNVPLEVKSFVASPGGYETPDGTRDRRWHITPRAGRATAPPGGRGRIPMTVAFAASEEAGIKEFVLDLEITADRDYGSIRTTATAELGLPEISLELAAVHAGADVVVEARINNRASRAMDLDVTATAPDQPRSKAPVSQLPPGKQAVRRFPYARAYDSMKGKRVSVAVLEPETGARIVRSVIVE